MSNTPTFWYPQGPGWHPPIRRRGPHNLDLGWSIVYGENVILPTVGTDDAQVILVLTCDEDGTGRHCRVKGYKGTTSGKQPSLILQDVIAVVTGYLWARGAASALDVQTATEAIFR